jgi:hypothetical protein
MSPKPGVAETHARWPAATLTRVGKAILLCSPNLHRELDRAMTRDPLLELSENLRERLDEQDRSAEATYRAIGRRNAGAFGAAVKLDCNYVDVVTTHDFALLCTAYQQVATQTLDTEDQRTHLRQLVSRIRVLNDLRGKVVHGRWMPFHDGGTLYHTSRQNLRRNEALEMATQLEQQALEVARLGAALQVLLYFPLIAQIEAATETQ